MLRRVIARLKEQACPPLVDVDGLAAFAGLTAPPPRTPVAWVLPASDAAQPNRHISRVEQTVTSTISVLIQHRSRRDMRGDAAAVELTEDILMPVRRAIVNWRPQEGFGRFAFVSGRMLRIAEGVIDWEERFVTTGLMFGEAA